MSSGMALSRGPRIHEVKLFSGRTSGRASWGSEAATNPLRKVLEKLGMPLAVL
jgi:hypothetical protein